MEILSEKEIDITPDKSLMEKLGRVGFKVEQALAEFIDNALDARYDETTRELLIKGKINVEISIEKDKIKIRDDSSGIKKPEECLKPASSTKVNMLGSFGLGLKTASMSLGKKLTVITKPIHQAVGYILPLDLDEWYTDQHWKLKMQEFKANSDEHFTEIIVEKLWSPTTIYNLNEVMIQLAFHFSEFIQNNELEIRVNGNPCIPVPMKFIEPTEFDAIRREIDFSSKELPSSRKTFEFYAGGLKISGWVDLLARWSLGGRYGFNIYRGKRLLVSFQKIGIREHPTHSRIFGHIYLPLEAPVKFTKDGVEVGRVWFDQLREKVKQEIKMHVQICEKLAQKRRFFEVKPSTIKQLSDYLEKIENAFKRSSLIQQILGGMEQQIRGKKEVSQGVAPMDAEKRGPKINPAFKKPIPEGERVRQPGVHRQKKNSFYITIKGQRIKITHDFQHIEDEPVKMYYRYYSEDENEFQVVTNTHFDSWGLTKDEAFYGAMNIITALSEFVYSQTESPQFTVEDIREDLWRNVGKLAYKAG